jgi:hypothetical protein
VTAVSVRARGKNISKKIPWSKHRKSGECGAYGNRNKWNVGGMVTEINGMWGVW